MLAADNQGNTLLEFITTTEDAAPAFQPLTGALVVARWDGRYLFVFNRQRQQWEIPGGTIEEGETPRECAAREFKEETNQDAKSLSFCGLAKTSASNGFIEYTALFSAVAVIDKLSPFQSNGEIERVALWGLDQDIGEVNPIDRKLIDYA